LNELRKRCTRHEPSDFAPTESKQAASDEWIEAFCSLVRKWQPREWAEEKGQIKAGVGPFLERMQRERQAFVYRRDFPVRGDKAVRAQSIRGRMAIEGLYLPQDAPWVADLRSELLTFPAGKLLRRALERAPDFRRTAATCGGPPVALALRHHANEMQERRRVVTAVWPTLSLSV
jgi:hypothetical protein